jgi:outer membrane protein
MVCMAMLAALGASQLARAADPWHVMGEAPASPTQSMLDEGSVDTTCPTQPLGSPLGVFEAIERALCSNPKTRGAWADVKASAAALGLAKAAYLPTLNGTVQYVGEHVRTGVKGQPALDTAHSEHVGTQTLSLTWVLYDFGSRGADLDNAKKLLAAAQAGQSVELETAYINAAKDYYTAEAGLSRVVAMQRVEDTANTSLIAASARVQGGAAAATDRLQAKTAYTLAQYNRVKAEASYRSALGSLAIDMGLAPDAPLTLPVMRDESKPEPQFVTAIHDLIEEAERKHPTVLQAQAQWEASEAKARSIKAQGMPTLSLVAQSSHDNNPTSGGLGQAEMPAVTRNNYLGLKLDVPLFEGQGRSYRVKQAHAQADSQREAMHDVQRQVATKVWSNYQELLANTQAIDITREALDAAQQAFDVMKYRYGVGISNILDLLSAQEALAKAEEQHIEAETDWYTAKLQLAASLGKIELLSVTTYE